MNVCLACDECHHVEGWIFPAISMQCECQWQQCQRVIINIFVRCDSSMWIHIIITKKNGNRNDSTKISAASLNTHIPIYLLKIIFRCMCSMALRYLQYKIIQPEAFLCYTFLNMLFVKMYLYVNHISHIPSILITKTVVVYIVNRFVDPNIRNLRTTTLIVRVQHLYNLYHAMGFSLCVWVCIVDFEEKNTFVFCFYTL